LETKLSDGTETNVSRYIFEKARIDGASLDIEEHRIELIITSYTITLEMTQLDDSGNPKGQFVSKINTMKNEIV